MTFFNKIAFYILIVSNLGLVVLVLNSELDYTTKVPKGIFLPIDAVPDVEKFIIAPDGSRKTYTVKTLTNVFFQKKYSYEEILSGRSLVPQIFVATLPIDIKLISVVEEKKNLFIKSILPLVLRVNEEILFDREKLLKLSKMILKGHKLKAVDRLWLAAIRDRYKVLKGDMNLLRRRVDIIPPSLAIAQAAEESGWGTSRFALEGNALFGQWTEESDRGLVPIGRMPNGKHRVKSFSTLLEGVRSYVHNLNTHRAYRNFRKRRAESRRVGLTIKGRQLSKHLKTYSARGDSYIKSINSIMIANNLSKLDNAKLRQDPASIIHLLKS